MLFDLEQLQFGAREGKYYKLRDAAKFLKLNCNVLSLLKKEGIYKIKRLGWGVGGFSELDMIEFRGKLLNTYPLLCDYDKSKQVSFAELLRKKRFLNQVLNVFRDISFGLLTPIGRVGDQIPDIVFSKSDLEKTFFKA